MFPNKENWRISPKVLLPDLLSSVELACERGSSNWFSCLPLKFHGFALLKTAFRDAVMLRYHWTPPACPTSCPCGHDFTIDHCISCPKGGFPSLRHNEVYDLTAMMVFQLSLIFSNLMVKLFDLGLQTLNRMHVLILPLMASGVEGLNVLFLMYCKSL